MTLSPKLQEMLDKIYPPSSQIDDVFKGSDITLITDETGRPVLFFIGKRSTDGTITGQHFVRLKKPAMDGSQVLSDHWDKAKIA
jgi:hypothetical protein